MTTYMANATEWSFWTVREKQEVYNRFQQKTLSKSYFQKHLKRYKYYYYYYDYHYYYAPKK